MATKTRLIFTVAKTTVDMLLSYCIVILLVAPLLAGAIERIHHDVSISSLFRDAQ
jgi:phosphoribosylpyrophosphate synthetase